MSGGEAADAIQYAQQLGRLDLVTVILGALTVVIVISVFPIFLWLRSRAADIAREEVNKLAAELLEKLERQATESIQEMIPQLVEEHLDLVKNLLPEDVADRIANAQNDGEHP